MGKVGSTVTINGSFFNATPANNLVSFGGVQATVVSGNATSLTVTVPPGTSCKPVSVLNRINGLTGYSGFPFRVTADNKNSIAAADIDPKVDFAAAYSPQNICIGDIDGDGKPDMAVLTASSGVLNTISLFRNAAINGAVNKSSFADKIDLPTGNLPSALVMEDMDGDGKPDLVIINKNDNNISVYHNNTTKGVINAASFSGRMNFATGASPLWLAIGDIDSDGRPDILTSNGIAISVLLNKAAKGSLSATSFGSYYDIARALQSFVLSDIDGDGKPDIAGVEDIGSVSVMRNAIAVTGVIDSASFEPKVNFLAGVGIKMVRAADLNNDNKPELIILNTYESSITVLPNATNGSGINSGSFLPKVVFSVGSYPKLATDIAFDDIDGDGRLDMLASIYASNSIAIFRGLDTPPGPVSLKSFASGLNIPVAGYMGSITTGDIDADGRPDILCANNVNVVSVLRNNPVIPPVITSITPMSGPVGTTVTISGDNFNKQSIEKNVVFFGGVKAVVRSATATEIVAIVPSGTTYTQISVLNTETLRSAYSLKPFNVTYTGNTGIKTVDFEVPDSYHYRASQYMNVELADIDNDGAPDMITGGDKKNTIYISKSGGLKTGHPVDQFNTASEFKMDQPIDMFRIGDLDGDGKADIVALATDAHIIYILHNKSTKSTLSFDEPIAISVDEYNFIGQIALGDIDGDGKLDIISDRFHSTVFIYRNTSSTAGISFTASYGALDGVGGENAQIGDIDGDGRQDLVYSYYDYSYGTGIYIARNISLYGEFKFEKPVRITEYNSRNFRLADVNGDDKLDILLAGQIIFKNTATKGIISPSSVASPVHIGRTEDMNGYSAFKISDMDGDGKPDVIIVNPYNNNHNTLSVFRNTFSGTDISFDLPVNIELPSEPGNLAVSDMDGDNYPDALVTTSNGIVQAVYYHPEVIVTPPRITGVTPLKGPSGSQFTITGSGFSVSPAGNTVTMGNVNASVSAASVTSLTVTVPVSSTFGKITVTNNENKRVSNSWEPYVTTFTSKKSISEQDFNDPVHLRTGRADADVIITDLDDDGKLDLVSLIDSNYVRGKMSVRRNVSVKGKPLNAASFASNVDFMANNIVALIDVNGDGKPDILSRGGGGFPYGGSFSVSPNVSLPGYFAFDEPLYTGTGYANIAFTAVDIDGDGLPDVVSSGGEDTKTVMVSANISRRVPFTFETENIYPIVAHATSLVVNDIDGDNKPDIITGNDDGSISILRNKATPGVINAASFESEKNIPLGKKYFLEPIVGDIDGDGKPDVLVASSFDATFLVLRNTSTAGKISFAPPVEFATPQLYKLLLSDVDGDGKLDIITVQQNNYTEPTGFGIYENLSTPGNFTINSLAPRVDMITGAVISVAAGDLNGDSKPDILANSGHGVLSIYQNSPHTAAKPTISAFAPQIAEQGTVVTIKGTDFTNATSVTFGGNPAASFTVWSPKLITAVVGNCATGLIAVNTPLGTGSLSGFTYGVPKTIGPIIKPLADTVAFELGSGGDRPISLADVATVTGAGKSAKITLTPSNLNCTTLGNHTITVKVEDASAVFNPSAVKFNHPSSVTFDAAGNMYIADYLNFRVRKITTGGVVSTLAGNGSESYNDGKGSVAGIGNPGSVITDPFNNVFVGSGGIRKIDTLNNVTTLAGNRETYGQSSPGPDIASSFRISAMTLAPDGSFFITDASGGTVMKITQTGIAVLYAGVYGNGNQDGEGSQASFNNPQGITADQYGNLYVADSYNYAIRKITLGGVVSTMALKGPEKTIYPRGITVDSSGILYIINGNSIASISTDGTVKTIAGNKDQAGNKDGQGIDSRFNMPTGIALDGKGDIYVADANNNTIRKIDAAGKVITFAGEDAGYQDGSIGSPASSVTAQVNVKVNSGLTIVSTFADKLLPLNYDGKAILPDYTLGVAVASNCGLAGIKISQQPAAGTRLNASEEITLVITAADASGYSVSKSFKVMGEDNKVIVFNPISSQVYGGQDLELNAVPPTNSTLSYVSSNPAVATIVSDKIHITGAGTTTITATSSGRYVNKAAQVLNVDPAVLTVKADDKTRVIGVPNPVFTFAYTGFVNSDKEESLDSKPIATTPAAIASAVGTYPITPGGALSSNYTFTYVSGSLTITNGLPTDNFIVSATSATCKGNNNGSISISAKQNLNYTATITGTANLSQSFTTYAEFNNLAAGAYNICITITGQSSYTQCYTLVITEPKDMSLYATVSNDKKNVLLAMSGGNVYHIRLNGKLYTTTDSTIRLPLETGKNELILTSDISCQGILKKLINISDFIIPYPNPFTDALSVDLGKRNPSMVTAEVYSAMGNLIYTEKFVSPASPLRLNLSGINTVGTYTLKLTTDDELNIFKIIKK